jgi:DNA topoisomerase-3
MSAGPIAGNAAGKTDGKTAVVAEKPSVARDLAKVLGAQSRGNGYLHGNGYVVTWAIGHLVTLPQPHEIRPEWKRWAREHLPILPREWPLVVSDLTRDQFEVVRRILSSAEIERVVCATDAGREGELIFRHIYEAAGCSKPFSRLWISSLTEEAIREGFRKLRDGREYDPLADAARGRSRADWLVGMNFSRACTIAFDEFLSVGRVQTPTLAMVVERELQVRAFVPQDYLEVVAAFAVPPGKTPETPEALYRGTWFRADAPTAPTPEAKRIQRGKDDPAGADLEEAMAIVRRVRGGRAEIESLRSERQRMATPLLYDLTELQRHANRLFGFSAQKTLGLAQSLYEVKKLLSYPRTDSRHLTQDVAATLGEVVRAIEGRYEGKLAPGTGERPLGRRFVDDAKVTDHHAILPTAKSPRGVDLTPDEEKIYDLVCRRLLMAWHGDHVTSVTTVITAVTSEGSTAPDRFHSSGTVVEEPGWKVLDLPHPGRKARKDKAREAAKEDAVKPQDAVGADEPEEAAEEPEGAEAEDSVLPPGLARGQQPAVRDVKTLAKKTRPPRRFTDATLLTAMETAGKTLDDKELSEAMKETGLGTPATRAETIETLLKREYIVRVGKTLEATDKGVRLIELVHPQVKSPALTGSWEAQLRKVQRGEAKLDSFLEGIEAFVREVVGEVFAGKPAERKGPQGQQGLQGLQGPARKQEGTVEPRAVSASGPRTPVPADRLAELLPAFRLAEFRPYQEAVCRAATEGKDGLVVMPTGAGKSLCYQLPGLARAGTTLVISPLIALMEDQVAKLRELGLRAERIHSGRDRSASRQACVDYLAGNLDFL